MNIETFAMERWQSTYEHVVDYDLSESGVEPIALRELLASEEAAKTFLDTPLGYPASKGTPALRSLIASLYADASPDQVLVTNGSSESIFAIAWRLVEPGDEVIVMLPNYLQYPGLVRGFGGAVKPLWLKEDRGWQFDPEELKAAVTSKTKAIAVCNPNNPTGAAMDESSRAHLVQAAEDTDAWILSDEVYVGAEREGARTATLFGEGEKVLVTNGLSKSYGLPGLRIGWAVGPEDVIQDLYRFHDYLSLTLTRLSDGLAQIALEPTRREGILARTRSILRRNYPILKDWLASHAGSLDHVPPAAGAICFVRYRFPLNSSSLAEDLRSTRSVLVVPGDHFGVDGHLRIGMGNRPDYLRAGLERLADFLVGLGTPP